MPDMILRTCIVLWIESSLRHSACVLKESMIYRLICDKDVDRQSLLLTSFTCSGCHRNNRVSPDIKAMETWRGRTALDRISSQRQNQKAIIQLIWTNRSENDSLIALPLIVCILFCGSILFVSFSSTFPSARHPLKYWGLHVVSISTWVD